MTSSDGITWITRTSPSNTWKSVCWSPELAIFTSVSDSTLSTNTVMTSSYTDKYPTPENLNAPKFSSGTLTASAPAVIPILFANTSYNYVEIKMRYRVSTACNITLSGNSNTVGSGTALSISENKEITRVNTTTGVTETTTGIVATSAETGIDHMLTIRLTRSTTAGANGNRNMYEVRSIYTHASVGTDRLEGFGHIDTTTGPTTILQSIILTMTASATMTGTYSTVHSY
jgi:hypothetical protein